MTTENLNAAGGYLLRAERNLPPLGREGSSYYPGGEPSRLIKKDVDPNAERLSEEIKSNLRAYNLWLQRRDDFCLDMDLSPQDPKPIIPIGFEEAMRRFKRHIATIEAIDSENRSDVLTLTGKRLRGMVAFREEEERVKRGEPKTPFIPLYTEVNGYNPPFIPWSELDDIRRELIEDSAAVGRPTSDNDEQIGLAITRYHQQNKLDSPTEIKEVYWRYATRYRSQLSQITNRDLSFVEYEILTKYQDAFWKMYERIGPEGFSLWLNWHPRHRNAYDRAVVQAYSIHEDFHETKGAIFKQKIENGELEPLAGLITIPGPDSYALEGEAMEIQELAGYALNPDTKLGTTLYLLSKAAKSNGIYLVEEGESVEEVARYLAKYMPLNTVEEIESDLREATTKTFDRVYQPVYGIAGHEYRQISRNLNRNKRIKFINYSMDAPRSRDQIQDLLGHVLVS